MSAVVTGVIHCPTCGKAVEVYGAIYTVTQQGDTLRAQTYDATARHKCKGGDR